MNLKVKVRRGFIFKKGEQGVVAELKSWEEKQEIMRRKKGLEEGIYIDNDLTREERERQQKLRKITWGERERKGKFVKVGYGKIFLEGRWRNWEEEKDALEKLKAGEKKGEKVEDVGQMGGKGRDREEKERKRGDEELERKESRGGKEERKKKEEDKGARRKEVNVSEGEEERRGKEGKRE